MNEKIEKVSIIGSGRVGYHLAKKLYGIGINIVQVFSRTRIKSEQLATLVNAEPTIKLSDLRPADLVILAVSDDAIESVAQQIKTDALVVHTSGATPSLVFAPYFDRYGVFYPLQSFSIGKSINWAEVPLCIDANSSVDQQLLQNLAQQMTSNVRLINDEQRKNLHVAAVFANNFANYSFHIAESILSEQHISFEILQPLILETAQKIKDNRPRDMQTGPAIRSDQLTIERHLELLNKHTEWKKVYEIMTKGIQAMKNDKDAKIDH